MSLWGTGKMIHRKARRHRVADQTDPSLQHSYAGLAENCWASTIFGEIDDSTGYGYLHE
jgi:hypothetical protein